MPNGSSRYERGAEWRQWDFHIHTPASFQWKGGKRFAQMTADERTQSIDAMIKAMNAAEPAAFVIMDYWTFEGWFELKRRIGQVGAPKLTKTVFPGIELRLVSPTTHRLNAHVVFSDDISDQDLLNFKSKLDVALIDQPLSDEGLKRLVREEIGADLLKMKGFNRAEVLEKDDVALLAGCKIAEITQQSYTDAISKVPNGNAIGFMPWETSDGLAEAEWEEHYAYVIGLMKSSPIFETRRPELWAAFVGVKTETNENWFDAFQAALDNTPRLAVSGSDAHAYAEYGKFPSGKATWIKADPTFLGLKQTLKEPAKRSFIGASPAKLIEVAGNKTYYIDKVEVVKNDGCPFADHWLASCQLPLNPELVAIIGNKGSGKSALADVIALLGDSKQKEHFSFLSGKRFRAKPKELARHFSGRLTWVSGADSGWRALSEDSLPTSVELVRYIPQAHFEKVCNDHVSGRSDVFEKELRSVIFSHTSALIRQKSLDFDQLIERQESGYRDQLGEYRKDLRKLNQEIESIEAQLQPAVRQSLLEQRALKEKQIEEHRKIEPPVQPKPSEQLTPEQQSASDQLESIAKRLAETEGEDRNSAIVEADLAARLKATQSVRERLHLLQRQYKQFEQETAADLQALKIAAKDVARLTVDEQPLDQLSVSFRKEQQALQDARQKRATETQELIAKQTDLNSKLNEPQQRYQKSLQATATWKEKLAELVGAIDAPDTLEGIEARILQLDQLPSLLRERRAARVELSGEIFDILEAQRAARAELFKPVQELIQSNSLIRDDYRLQFQATLGASPDALAAALFALIKQNSGEFRGEDESYATVRRIAERYDFGKRESVLTFVEELHRKIETEANANHPGGVGIIAILRGSRSPSGANKTPCDVYDLLYGLSFLEPRYSLLFQDTHIEQLSPGQRGALLLIFYLLVDKGRNPIILDQPEENLDNETVVSLLVPVLNEAKKKRQIIMVTHNPNLAVVCDAEQVIFSAFDRKDLSKISYTPGSIENPAINIHVVNVLEGTRPAFENRRTKYH